MLKLFKVGLVKPKVAFVSPAGKRCETRYEGICPVRPVVRMALAAATTVALTLPISRSRDREPEEGPEDHGDAQPGRGQPCPRQRGQQAARRGPARVRPRFSNSKDAGRRDGGRASRRAIQRRHVAARGGTQGEPASSASCQAGRRERAAPARRHRPAGHRQLPERHRAQHRHRDDERRGPQGLDEPVRRGRERRRLDAGSLPGLPHRLRPGQDVRREGGQGPEAPAGARRERPRSSPPRPGSWLPPRVPRPTRSPARSSS